MAVSQRTVNPFPQGKHWRFESSHSHKLCVSLRLQEQYLDLVSSNGSGSPRLTAVGMGVRISLVSQDIYGDPTSPHIVTAELVQR